MKHNELDKFEKTILRNFENGKFRPVKNAKKVKKQYQHYASATLHEVKDTNV